MDASDMSKEEIAALKRKQDKGAHYRNEYLGVPFDVYRALLLFKIEHPVAQHIFKKVARGTRKGHTEQEVIDEIRCCLDRWQKLIDEDSAANSNSDNSVVLKPRKVKFNQGRPHDD